MNATPIETTKGTILIVDDSPEIFYLLESILIERGYAVRVALDAALALESAQSAPPDLILLDIMLPDMDGYEVCQQLKADDRTRDIPVIFLSVLDAVFDEVKAFSLGAVDYITKPVEADEVLAHIKTHLTLQNLQRRLQETNARLQQEIEEHKQTEEQFRKLATAVEQSPVHWLLPTFRVPLNTSTLNLLKLADTKLTK